MPNDFVRADGSVDLDAVRAVYDLERDKRLAAKGHPRTEESAAEFRHWVDDPYSTASVARDPITKSVDVLIVGGGIGGLIAAAKLRDVGVEDITVIDRATGFGGTWYWNRYPGIRCDTESYIYLPQLEETGYVPSEKYARGSEILAHCERIATQYHLHDDALLGTNVESVSWDDNTAHWVVKTDRGDTVRARFVLCPGGSIYDKPKMPGIPGTQDFKGHTFHTSRWDYAYTGGDPDGGMLEGLQDKRVGIIGTGATAIQLIPELAASAAELYVFQRTPSSIAVRDNRPTEQGQLDAQAKGWQLSRCENFTILTTGGHQDVDLVDDEWTRPFKEARAMAEALEAAPIRGPIEPDVLAELADFDWMEQLRARVDREVHDLSTAEALKPYYRRYCKRPCFSDTYLPTFNRPNVTLVDTGGKGVERLTEHGVVVGGREYPVDCLIFASGFDVNADWAKRVGFEITGRTGSLAEKWKAGPRTFQGLQTNGFPNLFLMGVTQTGLTSNFTHTLTEQAMHIAFIIDYCRKFDLRVVEATEEAEAEWVEGLKPESAQTSSMLNACTPGYLNNEGHADDPNAVVAGAFLKGPLEFFNILSAWRDQGDLAGLEQVT
jgi:cation diffusion facilitator CzcD-associated flavoprotein CzcO